MTKRFQSICDELILLIAEWEKRLISPPQATIAGKRNIQNRTIKEIVGHMVDSATNNTHRIIHLQYQESPISYPDYANLGNNDRWIVIQNYQDENWSELVDLWLTVHRHIVHVIRQVNEEKLGQIWISALGEKVSLKEMIEDYPRHFKLHLTEIKELF